MLFLKGDTKRYSPSAVQSRLAEFIDDRSRASHQQQSIQAALPSFWTEHGSRQRMKVADLASYVTAHASASLENATEGKLVGGSRQDRRHALTERTAKDNLGEDAQLWMCQTRSDPHGPDVQPLYKHQGIEMNNATDVEYIVDAIDGPKNEPVVSLIPCISQHGIRNGLQPSQNPVLGSIMSGVAQQRAEDALKAVIVLGDWSAGAPFTMPKVVKDVLGNRILGDRFILPDEQLDLARELVVAALNGMAKHECEGKTGTIRSSFARFTTPESRRADSETGLLASSALSVIDEDREAKVRTLIEQVKDGRAIYRQSGGESVFMQSSDLTDAKACTGTSTDQPVDSMTSVSQTEVAAMIAEKLQDQEASWLAILRSTTTGLRKEIDDVKS